MRVYPGVDNKLFYEYDIKRKIVIKEKYKIPRKRIAFLFIGNAIRRKGLDLLFSAVEKLNKKETKKAHVIICSEGSE